jgi:hypothetical protein
MFGEIYTFVTGYTFFKDMDWALLSKMFIIYTIPSNQ